MFRFFMSMMFGLIMGSRMGLYNFINLILIYQEVFISLIISKKGYSFFGRQLEDMDESFMSYLGFLKLEVGKSKFF